MRYGKKNPPLPPEGWRELKIGEKIKKGDNYFDYDYQSWGERNVWGRAYYPMHGPKPPFSHYITVRKLEKPIILTEEQKEKILNDLKINKAFNEDSACPVSSEDFPIYSSLVAQNLIGCEDERFYLKK